MRRLGLPVSAAVGLLLFTAGSAAAAPTPAPAPSGVPGAVVCAFSERTNAGTTLVSGLSGLVSTDNGYVVVSGAHSGNPRVYLIDNACKRTRTITVTGDLNVRDPQDLARSADGTLWVADSGDTATPPERTRIVLWKVPADGGRATAYRFSYPGGAAYDTEALLLNGDGTPIFVTRSGTGVSQILVPEQKPSATTVVPLRKAGEFTPQRTGTPNNFSATGTLLVTGGADAPDGKRVALRTLADAYVWDVTGGDVLAALTTGTPRITRLPGEVRGSAIAFSKDGAHLLTVSDIVDATPSQLLSYLPTSPAAAARQAALAGGGAGTGGLTGWFRSLTLEQLTYLVAGVGMVGVLMVFAGLFAIRRSRARRPTGPARGLTGSGTADGYRDDDFGSAGRYDEGYPEAGYPDAGSGGGVYGGASYGDGGYGFDEPTPVPAGAANGWGRPGDSFTERLPPVRERGRGGDRYGADRPDQPGRPGGPYPPDDWNARPASRAGGVYRGSPRVAPPPRLAGPPPSASWPDEVPRPAPQPPGRGARPPMPPGPGGMSRRPGPGPGPGNGRPQRPRATGPATGRVVPPPPPPYDYPTGPDDYDG